MRTRWTFRRIVERARRSGKDWFVDFDDGSVRCSTGFCPLAVVFMLPRGKRTQMPNPDRLPGVRTQAERLAAWRVAYAADSDISPDRKQLLNGLGL